MAGIAPRYWIASKRAVGQACIEHGAHGTTNWERRFHLIREGVSPLVTHIPPAWENDWRVFDSFLPDETGE